MKYYPMQMHLHSIHQPGASMESHIYNAYVLGMNYIRFTDHDTRTGPEKKRVNSFDFGMGELSYENKAGVRISLEPIGEGSLEIKDGCAHRSGNGKFGLTLVTSGKKHTRAMLSDVTLTLGLKHEMRANSRIIVDILLSQRPPEHKEAHLYYVIGEPLVALPELTAVINIDTREDGVYRLYVSGDIAEHPEVGGLDNVFGGATVLLEGEGSFTLDKLEIESIYGFNDLILRQRALADKIGERYGVKPFVTTEISGAGQHKNCFSTSVPVLDYSKGKITEEEAVAHVLAHGGIFAYNHPFESPKYKRIPFTREELDEIVAFESERLIACRVLGASLTEVGFPSGRGLFTLDDYLRLWDNLSLAGIFITGYGDSDSHKSHTAWFSRNNFASWIGVDESLTYPISEDEFNAAMVRGNVYLGDPVLLKGRVSLTCLDCEMGAVIKHAGEEMAVNIHLEELPSGATVRIIRSGNVALTEEASDSTYKKDYTFTPASDIEFVRVEAYDKDGRCFMLTNPIYFVSEKSGIEIPEERLVMTKK